MAGGYGLATWLGLAALLVPASLVPRVRSGSSPAYFHRTAWLAAAVLALVSASAVVPLRYGLWELIPNGLAYPDELAHAMSLYVAVALGALAALVAWRIRHRGDGRPNPLWVVALFFYGARTAAAPALQIVAPGREGLFDVALLLVVSVALSGFAARLGRRALLALVAAWSASGFVLCATIGASHETKASDTAAANGRRITGGSSKGTCGRSENH